MKKIITTILLCLTTIMTWADEPANKPFIESLTGSISGNTLTLTATMNYANIENTIKESVKYHWKKGDAVQDGNNNVFTDNNAFTPTDITWEVYATYTYNEQNYSTEVVTYTQKRPTITLFGFTEGDDYKLTATLNTCGVEVSDIKYFYLSEESDTQIGTEFTSSSRVGNAINFEGRMWWVYATFNYNGSTYRSYCRSYEQEPSSLPILSVAKNEDHSASNDRLVMTATLNHEYGDKITNILYHWSKNGGEIEGDHTEHMTSPHSFATQNWSCYATFLYDGKIYQTNTETYTYYSTLGHITIVITKNDNQLSAELWNADADNNPTTVFNKPENVELSYKWHTATNSNYSIQSTCTLPQGASWVQCTITLSDGQGDNLEKKKVYRLNDEPIVVYLNTSGSNGTGYTSDSPVNTWKRAYALLPAGGNWDENIIVVQGTANLSITEGDTNGGVPATITGVWPWNSVTGQNIQDGGKLNVNDDRRQFRIGADTKFKNICFTTTKTQCHLCLFLHNTTFDTGCIMKGMNTLATNMGAMTTNTHKAPNFHLMLFSDEHDFTTHGVWNQTAPMTLSIKSGRFGRILCTRIAGTSVESQIKKRYVVGTPDNPLMAKIVVDIDPSNDAPDYNPTGYKDDIAFLCAGTTQGTVYADIKMDIHRGKIATIVAGSQGNAIAGCVTAKLPTSSYFGRTTINVQGATDSDVTIFRYFGGCLGRFTGGDASGECKAYFYGHSTLNLNHGIIEQNVFASAGGLSGLQNPNAAYLSNVNQHTSDIFIPYQGGTNNTAYPYLGIDYNSYDRAKQIVKVNSTLNGKNEIIDLADTKIVFNINGGIIKGNVYGGSYGYSSEMNVGNSPAGAGSLWGNTEINISGGSINGSVYGGGGGATDYYTQETKDKSKFLNVATVYGNTNVTITGTPDIRGNIYGGGAGVDATNENQFLEIARVYGNTNVVFNADYTDQNPFKGNIYGGGAKGGVEGNTNVTIKKGVIVGNVFGGSQGQEGYSNKAKVVGTTKVVIGE